MDTMPAPGMILEIKDRSGEQEMLVVVLVAGSAGLQVVPLIPVEDAGEWDQLLSTRSPGAGLALQIWNHLAISPEQIVGRRGKLSAAEVTIAQAIYASLYEEADQARQKPAISDQVGRKIDDEGDPRAARQQYWAEQARLFWHTEHATE